MSNIYFIPPTIFSSPGFSMDFDDEAPTSQFQNNNGPSHQFQNDQYLKSSGLRQSVDSELDSDLGDFYWVGQAFKENSADLTILKGAINPSNILPYAGSYGIVSWPNHILSFWQDTPTPLPVITSHLCVLSLPQLMSLRVNQLTLDRA